jgi:hypothetical protein
MTLTKNDAIFRVISTMQKEFLQLCSLLSGMQMRQYVIMMMMMMCFGMQTKK